MTTINLKATFLNEVRLKLDLSWTLLIGAIQKLIMIIQLMRSLIGSVCHTSIESIEIRSLRSIHTEQNGIEFEIFSLINGPYLCTTDFVRLIEFNEYLVTDVALAQCN